MRPIKPKYLRISNYLRRFKLIIILLLVIVICLPFLPIVIKQVFAASYTWNNGAGNMLWNTTSLNFTGLAWGNTNADTATFGATGIGAINVATPITLNGMTVSAAGYSFTGNSLTFAGTSPFIAPTSSFILNSNVTATAATLSINGANTITFGGALNNFSTIANNGNTEIFAAGTVSNFTGNLASCGCAGSGGAKVFTINGTVNVAGQTRINDKTWNFGPDAVAVLNIGPTGILTTGSTYLGNGNNGGACYNTIKSTVTVNAGTMTTGSIGNGNPPNCGGASVWQLEMKNGGKFYSGTTDIFVGSNATGYFKMTNGGTIGSTPTADLVVSSRSTLTINTGTNNFDAGTGRKSQFNNVITGAGGITKTGAGIVALNGANTFTGPINVTTGELQINGTNAAAVTYTLCATCTLSGTGTITAPINLPNGANIQGGTGSGNSGTLTINNTVNFGGANSTLIVNTNGTNAVSKIVSNNAVNVNNAKLNITGLLNPGTYDIVTGTTVTGVLNLNVNSTGNQVFLKYWPNKIQLVSTDGTKVTNSNPTVVDTNITAINTDLKLWTGTGAPSGRKILKRYYQYTETGGDTASITITCPDNSSTELGKMPEETNGAMMIIIDDDNDFSNGAKEYPLTLNGTTWEIKGVDIDNNQYFTFTTNKTASPGGVDGGLSYYIKADGRIVDPTTSVTSWIDEMGNWGDFTAKAGNPDLQNNIYNYNPGVVFSSSVNNYLTIKSLRLISNYFTSGEVYSTLNADSAANQAGGFPYSFGGSTTITNQYDFSDANIYDGFGTTTRFNWNPSTKTPSINVRNPHVYNVWSATNDWVANFDGKSNFTSTTNTPIFTTAGNNDINTYVGASPSSVFWGKIAEIALYDHKLTDTERLKINSYMSAKYGITLDQTTATSFIASDGTTKMWDSTVGGVYNKNITVIGRDDASALYQKQSKSTVSTGLIGVGLGNTIAATNQANTNTFSSDFTFMSFGDNNGALTWGTTGAPSRRKILGKVFKVQETGTVPSVKVQVPDSTSTLTTKLPATINAVSILVDDDGDFTTGAVETTLTLTGTNWEGNVDFTNGQYFTFATLHPGIVLSNDITINEGSTGTHTVVLSAKPTANVTVAVVSGTTSKVTISPATYTFTTTNWNVPQNITATGVQDNDIVNESVTLTATINTGSAAEYISAAPTSTTKVTVKDDDIAAFSITPSSLTINENAGVGSFGVKLLAQPQSNVLFSVVSNSTSDATINLATLTFTPANWNVSQNVTVTGVDDKIDRNDSTSIRLIPILTGTDPAFALMAAQNANVTLTDDDTAGFTLTQVDNLTGEDLTTGNFTLVLTSQPLGDVTIPLSSSDTTEGTVQNSVTFTIGNWNVPQTITINGVDDILSDGSQSYNIVTGDPSSTDTTYDAFTATTIIDVPMQNQDNDAPGILVNVVDNTVGEDLSTAKVQFSLLAQPNNNADVTIPLSISDLTEGSITQTSITITNANWNNAVANEITITGVDDLLKDGDIVFNLVTGDPTSADPLFDALTATSVSDPSITNIDNDIPGFTLSSNSLQVDENGGVATFNVKLNAQPNTNVNLDLVSSVPSILSVTPASLTFTSSNWNTNQTVTVTGIVDANFVNDTSLVQISVNASSDSFFTSVASQNVSVIVTDKNTQSPQTPDLKASSDNGSSQNDDLTNDNTPEFIGSCTSDDLIKIYIDNVFSEQAVCAGGQYTITIATALNNGAHNITSTATTPTFLESLPSSPLPIIIDTIKPLITLLGTTPINHPISTTYTDAGATASDNHDGLISANINTLNFVTTTIVGSYNVTYNVNDLAGNSATEVIRVVNVMPKTPEAPTNLTATGDNKAANLIWNAPITNGSPITDYLVEYSLDGNIWSTFVHQPSTFTSITVNGLASGTTYKFRVSAINAIGTSTPSNIATATTINTAPVLNRVGNSIANYLILDHTTGGNILSGDSTTLTDIDGIDHFGANASLIINISNGLEANDKLILNNNDLVAFDLVVTAGSITPSSESGTVISHGNITKISDNSKVVFEYWLLDTNSDGIEDKAQIISTSGMVTSTIQNAGFRAIIEKIRFLNTATPVVGTREINFAAKDIHELLSNTLSAEINLVKGEILLNLTNLNVGEGNSTQLLVKLNVEPNSNVELNLGTNSSTKFTVNPSTLTFTPSNFGIYQTVTISGTEDPDILNENGLISISVIAATSDDGYDNAITKQVATTITDNDGPGFTITESASSTILTESGNDTISIKLNTSPSNPVTLNLISSLPSKAFPSPSSLMFDNLNWNQPQSVTINGINDNDTNNELVDITISVSPQSAAEYVSINPQNVRATVSDDDTAGLIITESGGNTIMNEGSNDTVKIHLATSPDQNVVVNVTSDNPKATLSASSFTFNSQNWNIDQTLTINATEDHDTSDESITLTYTIDKVLSAASYVNVANETINASIKDNDKPGLIITESNSSTIANEGANDTFKVKLAILPTNNVTVTLNISDNTKSTLNPSTLTFTTANWNSDQTVTVNGTEDSDILDETLSLSFDTSSSTATEYSTLLNNSLNVTIIDNDSTNALTPDLTSGTDSGSSSTDNQTNFAHPKFSGTCRTGDKVRIYVDNVLNTIGDCVNNSYELELTLTPSDGAHNVATTLTTPGKIESAKSPPLNVIFDLTAPKTTLLGSDPLALPIGGTYTEPNAKSIDGIDGVLTPIINITGSVNTAAANTYPITYKVTDKSGNETTTIRKVEVAPRVPEAPVLNTALGGMYKIDISWTSPVDNGAAITDYKIEYSKDGINWAIFTHPSSTSTSTSITSLIDGTNYQIRVSAINSVGTSMPSNVMAATTSLVPTSTPGLIITQTNGGLSLNENNNDTFTIQLKVAPTNPVKVNITSSNTAVGTISPSQLIFTNTNWNSPQTVTLTGVTDDNLINNNTTVNISVDPSSDSTYTSVTPQNYTAIVKDVDSAGFNINPTSLTMSENGGTGNINVVLTKQPQSNVVLNVNTSSLFDTSISANSLTFTNTNWNTPQILTVNAIDDSVLRDDFAMITFSINPSTSDDYFDALDPKVANITLTDDDAPGIELDKTTINIDELNGTQTFNVKLHRQPVSDVVIDITNTSPENFEIDKPQLKFTTGNWSINQTITVKSVDDNFVRVDSGDILISINDNLSDNRYDSVNDITIPVTINEDDMAGYGVSTSSLTIGEGGGKANFTIKLNRAPVSPVTFKISSSTTDVTLSYDTLVFNFSNWNTPKTIIVTGVEDSKFGDDTSIINVSIDKDNTDDAWDNLATNDINVTIDDNETPNVVVDKTELSLAENTGDQKYNIKLSSEPSANVTISLNNSEIDINPATITFTSTNWNTNQEIIVKAKNNEIIDGTRTYKIIHNSTSTDTEYNSILIQDVIVTVTDDDVDNIPQVPPLTQDVDGVTTNIEDQGPNQGDANNDGIKDSEQANVVTLPTADGNSFVTLEASGTGSCPILENVYAEKESNFGADLPYEYPFGLVHFETKCSTSVTITMIWHGLSSNDGVAYRKFGPMTPGDTKKVFYDYGVKWGTKTINGKTVVTATFTLTDGLKGDDTGVDGKIVDPSGPIKKVLSETTKTGAPLLPFVLIGLISFAIIIVIVKRKNILENTRHPSN